MNVTIRRWNRADLAGVQQLLRDTWRDAYGGFIPRHDLDDYLARHYPISKFEELLADPDVTGLIAEEDGALAGYAKLFQARAEQRFYLHQLYILPGHQGTGIGRRLMTVAEERARELGFDRIWLGVMIQNVRAVKWYQKLGFTVAETTPFVMGSTAVDHYIGYIPFSRNSVD